MELIQIHWQYKDREETEFVAQREIANPKELRALMKELWVRHPPPQNAIFVLHTQNSKYFIKTTKPPPKTETPDAP